MYEITRYRLALAHGALFQAPGRYEGQGTSGACCVNSWSVRYRVRFNNIMCFTKYLVSVNIVKTIDYYYYYYY